MKAILGFLLLGLNPIWSWAGDLSLNETTLDGTTFCRTFISNGGFGRPKGEQKHCIHFDEGMAVDTAGAHFGNPPVRAPYTIKGETVRFGKSVYRLSVEQKTLTTVKGTTQRGTVFMFEQGPRGR